ncbi:MAG: penicillin acylase family protein [Deltaproteobacteria bacterium]|nr:penicillin acylase family protein [Deltaproteobacteria bacterium]
MSGRRRWWRWIRGVALCCLAGASSWLACGCAAVTYLGYRISPDFPEARDESIALSGLGAPVRVLLDDLGVPHVDADSEADLLRAVGFVHGRERFFQMDTIRRYARGRLSELVGEQAVMLGSTVELDRAMRGWGFERDSRAEAAELRGESARLLNAYVEGVNAALVRRTPIEYRLLDVEPEPWTAADSFAVGYMISWGITHNWRQELSRLILALHGGWERAEAIYPSIPWPGPTSLPPGPERRELPVAVPEELRALFPARSFEQSIQRSAPRSAPSGLSRRWRPAAREPARLCRAQPLALVDFTGASNGWVLAGARTISGSPLVASDPHLPHMLPSIMFQQHLRCRACDLDVIGGALPGLPYVLVGHNRKVAWAMTSAVADVVDLYIEKLAPGEPERVLGPAGAEPLAREEIEIRVRDGVELETRRMAIRRSARGPLVNDLYPGLLPPDAPLVSIRTVPMGAAASFEALRKGNRAESTAALREALIAMASPINTYMAADTDGHIALFANGRVPIRAHRGTFPAPAWVARYDWQGYAPAGDMPHDRDSPKDYYAHGNNLMADPARMPFVFQVDSGPSYRRDRIAELVEATAKHDLESSARIQADVRLGRARRLLPVMVADIRGLANKTPAERRAIKLLEAWDGDAKPDSAAAAIFFATYREAIVGAIVDEADAVGQRYLLSQRYFPNAVDLWFDDAENPAWDHRATAEQERRPAMLRSAFRRALRWLAGRLGTDDPRRFRWGELHAIQPAHAFGAKIPAFNLEPFQAGGGLDSVWKSHFDLGRSDQPFKASYGPVFRAVMDLSDLSHAWWVVDTGSSGWPGSPHYGDQYPLWQRVEYAPMTSDWDEIKSSARAVLSLEPAQNESASR